MVTIAAAIESRPAKERMSDFLAEAWRPFSAVIEDRVASPFERSNKSLWPRAELAGHQPWAQHIGFDGEVRGMERAWQMTTIRWIALQVGSRKYFPEYELPLRFVGSMPSLGKVPFWIVNGQETVPILVNQDWTPEHLIDHTDLPPHLQAFVVDRLGVPVASSHDGAFVQGFHTDASFCQHIREELAHLERRLRSFQ